MEGRGMRHYLQVSQLLPRFLLQAFHIALYGSAHLLCPAQGQPLKQTIPNYSKVTFFCAIEILKSLHSWCQKNASCYNGYDSRRKWLLGSQYLAHWAVCIMTGRDALSGLFPCTIPLSSHAFQLPLRMAGLQVMQIPCWLLERILPPLPQVLPGCHFLCHGGHDRTAANLIQNAYCVLDITY